MNDDNNALRALSFVSACLFMIASVFNFCNGNIRLGIGTVVMGLACTACGFFTYTISTAR